MFQRMSLLWFYVAGWNKRQLVKFVLMKNNSLLLWDRHIFVPCCGGKVVIFSVFLRFLVNEVVFSLNRTAGFYWTEESLENCHREFTFNKISWRLLKCFCFFRNLVIRELQFCSFWKTSLSWRYHCVEYKKNQGTCFNEKCQPLRCGLNYNLSGAA